MAFAQIREIAMSAYSTTLTRPQRLSKTVDVGIGSAYGIVTDNPTYQYQVYGRLSLFF